MPRLVNSITRAELIGLAVNRLLLERGPEGLTLRRIAQEARLSTSSLLHHLESRERLLRVAADIAGEHRLEELDLWLHRDGVLALLPRGAEDVLAERAWLAWCELGRAHEWLAPVIDRVRERELDLIARHYDYRIHRDELDTIMALVDGLTVAICRPDRPMSPPHARELMRRQLRHLLPPPKPGVA